MGNSSLSLDVGQANELKLAFRRFDWDNQLIKRLCEKDCDVLDQVLNILRGDATVTEVRHVVDLSKPPVLDGDDRAGIIKHVSYGKKIWNDIRLRILDPDDLDYSASVISYHCREMRGFEVDEDTRRKWEKMTLFHRGLNAPRYLMGQRLANINMRDFLLAHPHLMPVRFTSEPILFWGTIIRDKGGHTWVPGIAGEEGSWREYDRTVPDLYEKYPRPEKYDNPCAVFV